MKFVLMLAAMLLSGCAITGSVTGGIPLPADSILASDLKDAAFNLDNAQRVGALAADDPAPKCLHELLVQAGLEVPAGAAPVEAFDPKRTGIVSEATIVYIRAQQAKVLAAMRLQNNPACESLVGKIVIDGTKTVNKSLLGAIPGIKLR